MVGMAGWQSPIFLAMADNLAEGSEGWSSCFSNALSTSMLKIFFTTHQRGMDQTSGYGKTQRFYSEAFFGIRQGSD
jgi:hypothetical protein